MHKMIKMLQLTPDQNVLDVGAGTCELLIRLIEHQVRGTAIELCDGSIEVAKERANGRVAQDRITFINEDAGVAVECFEPGQFDVGICIGSTHALGGLEQTLRALKRIVKKDGFILIGEGYWKQRPHADYLEALGGAEESELQSHYENVMTGENMGLITLWSYVASEEDWDEYEWLYSMSVENYCHEHPDDPDHDAMLTRIRSWRQTYLKWGRDTLGFGLYLFRN